MGLEPYKDKTFLYEHYVTKRMNLTDIVKLLEKNYNIKTSPQTIYNWCKKYELLRYRGKGRNLAAGKAKVVRSPAQKMVEQRRREMRKQNELKKRGKLK
jgi:GTP-binding protein EngB required for normal cell division